MKKIIISLVLLLSLTGCGNKSITLDLEKVEIEVNSLEYEEEGVKSLLFLNNQKMDIEKIQDKYGMDTSIFEEILISASESLDTASMYAIFLPKEGKENECEEEINEFFEKYDQAWIMGYFPEEEILVENRSSEKYGRYFINVISKDNDRVIEKIKNTK